MQERSSTGVQQVWVYIIDVNKFFTSLTIITRVSKRLFMFWSFLFSSGKIFYSTKSPKHLHKATYSAMDLTW